MIDIRPLEESSESRRCAGIEMANARARNRGPGNKYRRAGRASDDRGLCELAVDGVIDTIKLHTNVAGIKIVFGNVVELVTGRRQLQPRERQQRQP